MKAHNAFVAVLSLPFTFAYHKPLPAVVKELIPLQRAQPPDEYLARVKYSGLGDSKICVYLEDVRTYCTCVQPRDPTAPRLVEQEVPTFEIVFRLRLLLLRKPHSIERVPSERWSDRSTSASRSLARALTEPPESARNSECSESTTARSSRNRLSVLTTKSASSALLQATTIRTNSAQSATLPHKASLDYIASARSKRVVSAGASAPEAQPSASARVIPAKIITLQSLKSVSSPRATAGASPVQQSFNGTLPSPAPTSALANDVQPNPSASLPTNLVKPRGSSLRSQLSATQDRHSAALADIPHNSQQYQSMPLPITPRNTQSLEAKPAARSKSSTSQITIKSVSPQSDEASPAVFAQDKLRKGVSDIRQLFGGGASKSPIAKAIDASKPPPSPTSAPATLASRTSRPVLPRLSTISAFVPDQLFPRSSIVASSANREGSDDEVDALLDEHGHVYPHPGQGAEYVEDMDLDTLYMQEYLKRSLPTLPTHPSNTTPPPAPKAPIKVNETPLHGSDHLATDDGESDHSVHSQSVSLSSTSSNTLGHTVTAASPSQATPTASEPHRLLLRKSSRPIAEFKRLTIKRRQMRRHIIKEIVATENTFTDALRVIKEVWMNPVFDGISPHNGILDPLEARTIFKGIDELLEHAVGFHSELQEIAQDSHNYLGIAQVFLRPSRRWSIFPMFVRNFTPAQDAIKRALQTKPFAKFHHEVLKTKAAKNDTLASMLILPIQRITRYPLLLQKLLKQTAPTHWEHDIILRAIAQMEKHATQSNVGPSPENSKARIIIANHMRSLRNIPLMIYRPSRQYITETHVREMRTDTLLRLLLFDDLLLMTASPMSRGWANLTKRTWTCTQVVDLTELTVVVQTCVEGNKYVTILSIADPGTAEHSIPEVDRRLSALSSLPDPAIGEISGGHANTGSKNPTASPRLLPSPPHDEPSFSSVSSSRLLASLNGENKSPLLDALTDSRPLEPLLAKSNGTTPVPSTYQPLSFAISPAGEKLPSRKTNEPLYYTIQHVDALAQRQFVSALERQLTQARLTRFLPASPQFSP
ncbi:Rho guanine nucleotide exchange factor (GEF) 17 [Dimargaris verticillata]|uniref:Rho guanine nucleotide exchange factor (GEF) 17 n=1 Tax=Dimargaris verticillata TaxID=2761393 RepID=A0A9W8EFX6_9FUNG|nr:Rho guanine nucleotide exchange factor (GEF) 17 [Dimargaris verticillata]